MKLAQIESVAQEIISATAPLVGGRTINIMDTAGIIIASSDTKRVGTFHQGAAQVLQSRLPLYLYPEDLPHYAGAREGVNLPIIKRGKLLGVVGILGNPDEVKDIANLLGVYVGLYLEQAAAVQRSLLRREMRQMLLGQLLLPPVDELRVQEAAQAISIRLRLPMRAILITMNQSMHLEQVKALDAIEELLVSCGLIHAGEDVYGVQDSAFLMLVHTGGAFHAENQIETIYSAIHSQLGYEPIVTIGGEALHFNQLRESVREARGLAQLIPRGCADIENNGSKALYIMNSLQGEMQERLLFPMYQALQEGFGGDLSWLMDTVETYCNCECSVTKAAQRLHIHKNTLLYRMKKAVSLLGLEEEQSFIRIYYLKLLLLYHRKYTSNL